MTSIEPSSLAVPSDATAFLAIIDRVARSKNADAATLKQLIEARERMLAQQAQQAYHAAMWAAQAEMEPVRADALNEDTQSRYASYFALDAALRPIYVEHGFTLSFDTADCPLADHVRVLCYVSHRGGHIARFHVDMPYDDTLEARTHAATSAMTYSRRTLLGMVFNIAVDKDDDGNAASAAKPTRRSWADDEPHLVAAAVGRQKGELTDAYRQAENERLLKFIAAGRGLINDARGHGALSDWWRESAADRKAAERAHPDAFADLVLAFDAKVTALQGVH